MARGKNRCYVCFKKHREVWKMEFTKDFPNKMKFCCACLNYADHIAKLGLKDLIKYLKIHRGYYGKVRRIFCVIMAKKVNKLITVE